MFSASKHCEQRCTKETLIHNNDIQIQVMHLATLLHGKPHALLAGSTKDIAARSSYIRENLHETKITAWKIQILQLATSQLYSNTCRDSAWQRMHMQLTGHHPCNTCMHGHAERAHNEQPYGNIHLTRRCMNSSPVTINQL